MRLKLFIILCLSLSLNAKDLSEILDSLNSSKKIKSLKESSSLEIAQSELISTYEAPQIELGTAHVDLKDGSDKGEEYSLGLSQHISHPFSSSAKSTAVSMSHKAIKQSLKHDIHVLNLDVSSKYHSACVAKEMKNSSESLYLEQSRRILKIRKAYELGEISKKEFLFYKLDLAKLQQSISSYKRKYLVELSTLQESVDSLQIDEVSCDDMQIPIRDFELRDINQHGEIQKISYELGASNAMYNVYDSTFKSLGYSLAYENELDAKRYGFSISMPLSFLTSKKEKERLQYLHESSLLNSQKDLLISEIKLTTKSSQLKLETLYDELSMLKGEILPLSLELYKLSISAQESGEGSMMESIDAARSYKENLLDMLEVKKSYYYEFFELHKIADLELGKNNEKNN